jgi:SAM-dependent methyltransferase
LALIKTNWPRLPKPTAPAIVALLIQCASLLFLILCLSIAWQTFQYKFSLPVVLVSQAVLTVLLTRWFGLAWWWCVIQPLFPFAVVAMLTIPLPPWLYLALFLILLVIYWSAYQTQVPYYPSTENAWQALEKYLPKDRLFSLVDIGSGLGGLILYLSKKYPDSALTGVEIAPLPWLVSYLRKTAATGNVRFLRSNYETLNFADFDVVFAYLSPAAMPALWIKAKSEMRPGTMLVSYEFPIIGVEEHLSIYPENASSKARKLYIWYL